MNLIVSLLIKLEAYEKRFKEVYKYNGILKYENRKLKEELKKRKNIVDFVIYHKLEGACNMGMYVELKGKQREDCRNCEAKLTDGVYIKAGNDYYCTETCLMYDIQHVIDEYNHLLADVEK